MKSGEEEKRERRGEGEKRERREREERESGVFEGRFLNLREERETFLPPPPLSPSFSLDTFTDRSRW